MNHLLTFPDRPKATSDFILPASCNKNASEFSEAFLFIIISSF
jgi:hypothetical protein